MKACSPRAMRTLTCTRIRCRPSASPRLRNWRAQVLIGTRRTIRPCNCATTWCAPRSRPSWSGRTPCTGAIRRRTTACLRVMRARSRLTCMATCARRSPRWMAWFKCSPTTRIFMKCAVRRDWRAASPRKRLLPCAKRCSSRITHRSSRCYLGKRWWQPIIRPTPVKQLRFCVRRWRERPRRRSAIPSSQWPMAERGISRRPTWLPHRLPSFAATTRPRANSPRAQKPVSLSAPPDGSRPMTSSVPNRCPAKRATKSKLSRSTKFSYTGFHQEELPMPSFRLLAPALFVLALCGTPPSASAQSFSDSQRGDIETIVRDYLLAHPEVLEEAMAELSKRQTAAEAEKQKASVATNAETIFNSPRGVVLGNKDGDVTFVEFFDYNCGYCKRAMADMLDLMKTDPKLKVVLKEFPVLSQGSIEAAQVAVAVRMQDPSGKKYLDFHQKLLMGRGAADKARAMAAAKEAGVDMAKLDQDLTSQEVAATLEA